MKRAALLLAVGMLIVSSLAARSAAFTWGRTASGRQAVEQQGNIPNPTPCVWDIDDFDTFTGGGDLAPGASGSVTDCIIEDWSTHRVAIEVHAASPDLVVVASIADLTAQAPAVPNGNHAWLYRACLLSTDHDHSEVMPAVGDGFGVQVPVTFSVSNPTERKVRDLRANGWVTWSYDPSPIAFWC